MMMMMITYSMQWSNLVCITSAEQLTWSTYNVTQSCYSTVCHGLLGIE